MRVLCTAVYQHEVLLLSYTYLCFVIVRCTRASMIVRTRYFSHSYDIYEYICTPYNACMYYRATNKKQKGRARDLHLALCLLTIPPKSYIRHTAGGVSSVSPPRPRIDCPACHTSYHMAERQKRYRTAVLVLVALWSTATAHRCVTRDTSCCCCWTCTSIYIVQVYRRSTTGEMFTSRYNIISTILSTKYFEGRFQRFAWRERKNGICSFLCFSIFLSKKQTTNEQTRICAHFAHTCRHVHETATQNTTRVCRPDARKDHVGTTRDFPTLTMLAPLGVVVARPSRAPVITVGLGSVSLWYVES